MQGLSTAQQATTGTGSMPFSRSIGLAAAGLVMLAIAVAGVISYRVMREELVEQAQESLQHRASHLAKQFGSDLQSMTAMLSGLGRNTVLTNALMDSMARTSYLEPFLQDFREINGHSVEMALVDFAGTRVSGSPYLTLRGMPQAKAVLQDGQRQAWLEEDDGGTSLLVAEPIFYYRTMSPEGAFLYRVELRALFDHEAATHDHTPFSELALRTRMIAVTSDADGSRTFVDVFPEGPELADGDEVLESRPVAMGAFADFVSIDIEVGVPRAVMEAPLRQLIAVYSATAVAGVMLALLSSALVGRRIARPLQDLERGATQIVSSGFLGHRFAVSGPREIARLAIAFNGMLQRLQDAHEQLSYLARFDNLTGLANRSIFRERLQEALAMAQRTGMLTALFLLDLDEFKQINDRFGHPAGDALLREVARRLSATIRRTDMVARLGGDEFAIIATNLRGGESVEVLARKVFECFEVPFDLGGQFIPGTSSIGIAICGAERKTSDDLLREADLALYQSKADNGNGFCFFRPELTIRDNARRKNERLIRKLLASGDFILHYQPKVDLTSGVVVGCEALLRLPEKYDEVQIGVELIPAAESSGLINPLGEWVIREACAQARRSTDLGLPFLPIAVNISAVQLRKPDLAGFVRGVLSRFDLPSEVLELEITETAVMERTDVIGETIGQLRELGVRLSIDDFGTGYSSLTYLKRFPVHALKIDRSFVDGVASSADDSAIARAVIALGRSLNLEVIAEGVETFEQEAFLKAHGCHVGQGYLYSRPLDAEALQAWWCARTVSPAPLRRIAGT